MDKFKKIKKQIYKGILYYISRFVILILMVLGIPLIVSLICFIICEGKSNLFLSFLGGCIGCIAFTINKLPETIHNWILHIRIDYYRLKNVKLIESIEIENVRNSLIDIYISSINYSFMDNYKL